MLFQTQYLFPIQLKLKAFVGSQRDVGVDNLGHFSDDSPCGRDNGFVPSWSPIKVDPADLVWEEDNFEKWDQKTGFCDFTPARLSPRIVSTFPFDI